VVSLAWKLCHRKLGEEGIPQWEGPLPSLQVAALLIVIGPSLCGIPSSPSLPLYKIVGSTPHPVNLLNPHSGYK
jgi:hypothetical protein